MEKKLKAAFRKISPFGAGVKRLLFRNETAGQTVAKNAFWLTVGNMGGRLLRAAIIIYAARVLGAAEWGVFSYALSLVALLTILVDFGLSPLLTRETVKTADGEARLRILSTAFFLKLMLLAGGTVFLLLVVPFFVSLPTVVPLLPFFALLLAFDTLRDFGFSVIRASEKMEREAGLFILTNLAIVIFGAFALLSSPSVLSFTLAYAAGTGVGFLATVAALKLNWRTLFARFSRTLVRPLLSSAWPFATAALLGGLMINMDVLIIGFFRTAEEVGYYAAAQRPILLLYLIPTIIATSAFPILSRFAKTEKERFSRALERILGAATLVAAPLAVGGAVVARELTILLYGTSYEPAALPFRILMITVLVNFTAVILSNALFALDRQRELLRYAALGALGNIALDLILIPPYGIAGSAWATFFAQVAANWYLFRMMRRAHALVILPHLGKIAAATILMAATAALIAAIGVHVLINIALSAILYFAVLLALREPILREIKLTLTPTKA
ncbi:MAG: flippase [Candidatus Liptonbacteria bacterium]|nr:flippase [Candidatus Liptonbacteria bacterium]